MTIATRRAWATIDLNALRHNLARVHSMCPTSDILAVLKANAYGHGMGKVAQALRDSEPRVAGYAVATVEEALKLRSLDDELPIMLLNGFMNSEELTECLQRHIEPVVHSDYQVKLIEDIYSQGKPVEKAKFWVKYNTGMNRLGMKRSQSRECYLKLHKLPATKLVLMSHLAWADEPYYAESDLLTRKQLKHFRSLYTELKGLSRQPVMGSLAASAGILFWPDTHLDIVRPGIMLYGSSPNPHQLGGELDLMPVMTLSSRVIAIRTVKAGESIGYGASWTCPMDTQVGTVSIGYGDGYPRSAGNGTPVVIMTAEGAERTQLIGRVSMDMITIDLRGLGNVQIDDEVQLWGPDLSIDAVADATNSISYELFCKITPRVPLDYVGQ